MTEWTNATISSAHICIESHGIFAWGLTFSGPGWVQGTGMRFLTAESLPTIEAIVRKFGPWNKLEGKIVRIGRVDGRGMIVAMRDILDDSKEVAF